MKDTVNDMSVFLSLSGLPTGWIPTAGHFSGFGAFGERASSQVCPELQDPAAGRFAAGTVVHSTLKRVRFGVRVRTTTSQAAVSLGTDQSC